MPSLPYCSLQPRPSYATTADPLPFSSVAREDRGAVPLTWSVRVLEGVGALVC